MMTIQKADTKLVYSELCISLYTIL